MAVMNEVLTATSRLKRTLTTRVITPSPEKLSLGPSNSSVTVILNELSSSGHYRQFYPSSASPSINRSVHLEHLISSCVQFASLCITHS